MAIWKKAQLAATGKPISRKSLAWLLVAQVFILAPHFFTAPVWIAIVWLMVAFWRWQIFQGAWNYPSKFRKTLVVAVCSAGLLLNLGANFGFQLMTSLLLVGFILKLLEMKTQRDFVSLIFIAFFIIAIQFIDFNHLPAALYGLFCLVILCVLLMQLHQASTQKNLWREFRPSLVIVLQAIPFMLILFVVIPRLGSFWAVPSPAQAKTGMSDSMSPGDFSKLMESNELAFRVTFEGEMPARHQLYWRSLVFSFFDGRRWAQNQRQLSRKNNNQAAKNLRAHIDYQGDKISYEVIAEPSNQVWLFALGAPESWDGGLMFTRDMRLQAFTSVTQRINYHVTSALQYRLRELDEKELSENRELPSEGNSRTREIAKEWMAETGSTEKLIAKLFDYYNKNFFYTLQPPTLGVDVVDEFLWQSRQGFCEHFASSFVFFMRAAGVPARVVVGYQGGEINSIDHYLSVRQRDAHAWAEVWLEGRGWVTYDPTAAVAPERVQKGIEESLSATDQERLGRPFGSSIKLMALMRAQWDALNYQWARWVMNYDSDLQSSLLEKWFGEISPFKLMAWVMGIGGSFLAVLMLFLVGKKKRAMSDSQQIYSQICKKLALADIAPATGETPHSFFNRAIRARPELAEPLGRLMHLFELLVYADNVQVRGELLKEAARLQVKK